LKAIEKAGYRPGEDIAIALDPASSSFCHHGPYDLHAEGRRLTSAEMVDMYAGWLNRYPVVVLDDSLAGDDWSG